MPLSTNVYYWYTGFGLLLPSELFIDCLFISLLLNSVVEKKRITDYVTHVTKERVKSARIFI